MKVKDAIHSIILGSHALLEVAKKGDIFDFSYLGDLGSGIWDRIPAAVGDAHSWHLTRKIWSLDIIYYCIGALIVTAGQLPTYFKD